MQVNGATDLASKSQIVSDSSNVKLKEEIEEDTYQMEIRCLCGSSQQADKIIQVSLLFCADPFVSLNCENTLAHVEVSCVYSPD